MKKLLKRKIIFVPLVTILLLVVVVGVAFACHGVVNKDVDCDGYEVSVTPSPDWGPDWSYSYFGHVRQRTVITYSGDPTSGVWNNGLTSADVGYVITWERQNKWYYGHWKNSPGYPRTSRGTIHVERPDDCDPFFDSYICHATESPTNPYVQNWPSMMGQLMGHVGPGHQNGEDIIPPIPGHLPSGQNWDADGIAIWENDCVEPFTPPDPITQTIYDADCEDIMAQDQEAVWVGGEDGEYGPWVNVGSSYQVWVWGDPYTLESWTAPDQSVIDEPAECQVPHIASTFLNNDCDGWEVGYMFDGVKNVVDSGIWNDPVAYEDATFSSFVIPVPAGEIVDTTDALGLLAGGTVEESARCHNFSLDDGQDADCDGWWRYVDLLDDGVFVKQLLDLSDSWSDIYTIEMLSGTTFFVPDAYGPDVVFSDLYEPTDCLILKTYKHHQAYLENNCEGIERVVNLYEGPASDPYQTLVGTHYNVTTLFTDPFSYETIPAQFVDIPDAYGPDYTFPAMIEPEVCHNFRLGWDQGADCDGYWRYVVLIDGSGAVKTLYDESGLWVDEFVLEPGLPEATLTFSAEYPPGQVSFLALPEPTECQSIHETDVWSESDCDDYSGGYWFDGEKFTTFSGAWLNLYGPESITETVIVPIPEGELGKKLFEVTIAKDMECLQCKTTIAYYQAMVRPTSGDVPPNYMTLPFNNGAFCAVITPKGTVPADDRITSVCSLCPEKYPDGYVFTGTATEADVAAVYKVECYGEGVTYFWFDKEWKWGAEYDPMYNIYGRELSCPRIDGCIDWIKENAPEGIYPVLEE